MNFSHGNVPRQGRADRKTPIKGGSQSGRPRLAAPPPGEEWDVDDEEAMASPLYSVTPHATKRFEENVVLSPFAPAVIKRPNEMKASLKSDKYLSVKEMSLTSQSLTQNTGVKSRIGVTTTPSKRPQLRPNSAKSSSLPTERKPFKPKLVRGQSQSSLSEYFSLQAALRPLLSYCCISTIAALLKVSTQLRRSRDVGKRFREALMAGLEFEMRVRYWNSVAARGRGKEESEQYFHSASHCPREIRDDIVRTPSFIPHHTLTLKQQSSLMRVLDAVCTYNRDVGYCQGMNYIGGFLVQILSTEEESFWVMNALLNEYRLKNLLKTGLSQLKVMCFQMDCFMQAYLKDVRKRLKDMGVSTEVFSAKWFVTLMCYELPFQLLMKVWDLFFYKGWKVFFRVILAVLSLSKAELMSADSSCISYILKTLPKRIKSHDTLLKLAFTFKVTRRLLSDLESLYGRKCKGHFQLIVGKNRKLEWLVTPKVSETTEDSSLASRLMSKVRQLFGREEQSREEDTGLDSTMCLEEGTGLMLGEPGVTEVNISLLSNEELKEALSIKDLDSGKVYYQDVLTPKSPCAACGSTAHSSQFCTEDIDMTPRILPALHLHPKVQESSARLG